MCTKAFLLAFGHTSPYAWAASRLRIRTMLYRAAPNVNMQPVRSGPMNRDLRCNATVFNQPKTSSTRFRLRWLTA